MTERTPRQPTEAMLNAARDWSDRKYGKPIGNDAAIGCWQAMFDAHTAAQPAPDAVAEASIADDASLFRQISELGNQIHNLGCEYQNDEKLLERLEELRSTAWELATLAKGHQP